MNPWTLTFERFDPQKERLREALCTLGNGYFSTHGATPECGADEIHYPETYLTGGYNRLKTDIAGHVVENEDPVNMPNWLLTKFRPEGDDWLNLISVDILQRCYAGLEFRDDILFLHSNIPRELPKLTMRIKYRGNWFDVTATPEAITIASGEGMLQAAKVSFEDKVYELRPGEALTFDIHKKALQGDLT